MRHLAIAPLASALRPRASTLSRLPLQRCLPLQRAMRCMVTYAQDPARWQSDPAVRMYGELLALKDTQQEAFLVAANTLRAQSHLPADLRASAARIQAVMTFQKAVNLLMELKVDPNAPFPREAFEATVKAAVSAVRAYEEAVADSSGEELCAAVAPYIPQWPEVIAQAKDSHVKTRTLLADLRHMEMNWHARQAERARDVVDAARRKDQTGKGAQAEKELEAAGLPSGAAGSSEEELWRAAAEAAERMVEECPLESAPPETGALHVTLTRNQTMRALIWKNLSVLTAMEHRLEESVELIVRGLTIRVEPATTLSDEAADQMRAAAHGVMELISRSIRDAETQKEAEDAASHGSKVAEAITAFNAWRGDSKGGGEKS